MISKPVIDFFRDSPLAEAELLGKAMPTMDGLIAVSGLINQCTVVTRNISDMEQSSAELFNPWEKSAL